MPSARTIAIASVWLALGVGALSLSTTQAWAQPQPTPKDDAPAPLPAPKAKKKKLGIKPPSFPDEPEKLPEQKVDPTSYVAAPESPPGELEAEIPRVEHPGEWGFRLELGWLYDSVTASHRFTGLMASSVNSSSSNPLSAEARGRLFTSARWLDLVGSVAASVGRAEAVAGATVFAATRYDTQLFEAAVGPRVHLLELAGVESASHQLDFGLDVGTSWSSFTTLDGAQDAIDVDVRMLLGLTPKIVYRYVPSANWELGFGVGYGLALSSSGSGDVRAHSYHKFEAGWDALRYIERANAVGAGLSLSSESVTWDRTVPSVLTDAASTTELRLNLFWRRDF